MTGEELARLAKEVCLTSLKNPHKSHADVGQDVYDVVLKNLGDLLALSAGELDMGDPGSIQQLTAELGRSREEVERLRAVLERIANFPSGEQNWNAHGCREIARAALTISAASAQHG